MMAYLGKREWLVKLRKDKGLSQSMCAAMSDMSQSYLNKIECGYMKPRQDFAERIARTLDFDVRLFETEDTSSGR